MYFCSVYISQSEIDFQALVCAQTSESKQQRGHQLSVADAEAELARIGKQIQVSHPNYVGCTNLTLAALFTLPETLGTPGRAGTICKQTKRGISLRTWQMVSALDYVYEVDRHQHL